MARQYQGELLSQAPPSGSQGPQKVPEAHPPAATPLAMDQHSPPILTGSEIRKFKLSEEAKGAFNLIIFHLQELLLMLIFVDFFVFLMVFSFLWVF